MKKLIGVVVFALAFAAGAFSAETAVGQVIHVDVESVSKLAVEGKAASMASLSAMVSSAIQDKDHVVVELKVPANLDAATLEQIKGACRKAGISRFSTVTKPAAKG